MKKAPLSGQSNDVRNAPHPRPLSPDYQGEGSHVFQHYQEIGMKLDVDPTDRNAAGLALNGAVSTRLLVWIAVLLFITGAGWFGYSYLFPDPAPCLAEARVHIASIATPPAKDPPTAAKTTESLSSIAKVLELAVARAGPGNHSARLLLAACIAGKEPGRAHQYLRNLPLQSCDTQDLNDAARLFARAQQPEVASNLIDTALEKPDHRVQTLQTAALVRFDQGLSDDVLKYCEEWGQLAPRDPEPWRLKSFVYEDRGQAEMLVEAYRNLLDRAPAEPDVRLKLVDSLVQLGDAVAARREFEKQPQAEREAGPVQWLTEARLLHLEGKLVPALKKLDAVLLKYSGNPVALTLLGRLQLSHSKFASAIKSLQEALKHDPTSLEAHYLLAQAYARSGNAKRAKQELALHETLRSSRVLINELEVQAARNPRDASVRQKLVELYTSIGMLEQAEFWKKTLNN
ncbi:MAG: tetratricopeptide repeat protein [Planctomycetaceae bacterium]|nr:tetratricopeptide repeat protein [Planctomycetaceae bacterium]